MTTKPQPTQRPNSRRTISCIRNKETIQGVLQEEKPTLPQGQASGGTRDPNLFDLLRTRRKELAAAARVPPYVIFSDRTLDEMATFYPQTGESLLYQLAEFLL